MPDGLVAGIGGVQVGELAQRQGNGLDDEIVDRELFVIGQKRIGLLAHGHQRVHLVFVGDKKVRDAGRRFHHPPGNGLSQPGERNGLVTRTGHSGRWCRRLTAGS